MPFRTAERQDIPRTAAVASIVENPDRGAVAGGNRNLRGEAGSCPYVPEDAVCPEKGVLAPSGAPWSGRLPASSKDR
jgi:hypothetical protein